MPVTKVTISKDGKFTLEGTLDTPTQSKSGKTMVILSTHGNITYPVDGAPAVTVGLNVYRKA